VFEYLSAGKPVVATPLDDILHLRSVISFAEGPDEFVKAVEGCLEEGDRGETVRMRVEASKRFSWDVIVDEFEERIDERLKVSAQGF
jgi:glycosyltransferase involved in cell wall biosynthesis